jgi:alkylated DNA repair protein alkB family protein 4
LRSFNLSTKSHKLTSISLALQGLDTYVYCPSCKKIFKGWQAISSCDEHESNGEGRKFTGFYILENFLTVDESEKLVECVDESLWDPSQSGRRKKNFGPKVNFKKKKLRCEFFKGFFPESEFIREKLNKVDFLKDFKIVEECFLEYKETRGSHIEPHLDDCWIW